jgi:propionyl-CoA carboxylase alpha chain
MPGLLTRLIVAEGDIVEAGQNVAIIEAMKMENVLKAEMKGIVSSISAAQGDSLNVDDVIITLAELDETK